MSDDSKQSDPSGPGPTLALLGLLPEIIRRAVDADRVCANCERYDRDQRCTKGGLFLPPDGPPWRDCRWFEPTEEFSTKLANRPKLIEMFQRKESEK